PDDEDPTRDRKGGTPASGPVRTVRRRLAQAISGRGAARLGSEEIGAALLDGPRHPDDASALLAADRAIRPEGRHSDAAYPSSPAPFLRDAPAGAGGRPEGAPNDAGTRGYRDHPDLHAGFAFPAPARLRRVSSAGDGKEWQNRGSGP